MDKEQIIKELKFRTSRSSGAGGQHVNKTESKVEVLFDVTLTEGLNEHEKSLVLSELTTFLDNDHVLHMHCETYRSQLRNKKLVVRRLFTALEEALEEQKERKPTRPSRSAVRKRLDKKSQRSEVKQNRGRWRPDD